MDDGTWTYTWQHGRQLASMAKKDGSAAWSFTYNADGLRTKRTDGTTTYNYVYNGSQLTAMTVGENTLYFAYDAAGVPMSVNFNGTEYFYTSNIQGDVTGIVNAEGTTIVTYTYDAWGNQLSCTGSMASTLGTLNPLRYRSYVYDQETNLYYLQSRYYNPQTGRFINADAYTTTGQGFVGNNMFAYCNNDTVNRVDSSGTCSKFLFFFKIDCKQASCPSSKNYVKPKSIKPYGTYNNGRGYVYIIKEDQLDEIMENKEDNVVVVVDKRSGDDPNMQIRESYQIANKKQQQEIAQMMLDYNATNPVSPAWSRTKDSLVEEWRLHNLAYSFNYSPSQTAHCDFNNADEGKDFWDFARGKYHG